MLHILTIHFKDKWVDIQKENLKKIKHTLLVSHYLNLEEYIDKLIRMVTNNRPLDLIEKHHKVESNLDKFM